MAPPEATATRSRAHGVPSKRSTLRQTPRIASKKHDGDQRRTARSVVR
jgi:hypothetical protein